MAAFVDSYLAKSVLDLAIVGTADIRLQFLDFWIPGWLQAKILEWAYWEALYCAIKLLQQRNKASITFIDKAPLGLLWNIHVWDQGI